MIPEGVAGLLILSAAFYVGIRWARMERRRVIKTDNAQFVALMRRLNAMAAILESVEQK